MTELYSGSCVKRACRENIKISKRKNNNKNLRKTELCGKEADYGGKQRLRSLKKKCPEVLDM